MSLSRGKMLKKLALAGSIVGRVLSGFSLTEARVQMGNAANFRALNLELFEDVDRFSVDLNGAVQDGYLQQRERIVQEALAEK